MADWLLNQPDIDAHSVDHEGWAPIHYAARFGHLELVEMLRKKDMDGRVDEAFEGDGIVTAGKELQTIDGWTVLHVAARFEQNEIITSVLLPRFFIVQGNKLLSSGLWLLECITRSKKRPLN